jgi:hypothetical protein
LLRTDQLSDDRFGLACELKLDGYRAIAFETRPGFDRRRKRRSSGRDESGMRSGAPRKMRID